MNRKADRPGIGGGPSRRGVLLLVCLSMLTLFMLLGVTYLVFASRVRTTSRAFLKLADDQARTNVTFSSFLKDAALQVVRGTNNSRSAILFHDLLGDKYGKSQRYTVTARSLVANNQLLRLRIANCPENSLAGRVVTFTAAPTGVIETTARIATAETAGSNTFDIWVVRPPRATAANIANITEILINGRDFGGIGFSSGTPIGTGTASLDNSALMPNQGIPLKAPLDASAANEDYDAIDEQNLALASMDGSVRSFERKDVVAYWVREFGRQNSISSETVALSQLLTLAQAQPQDLSNPYYLNIRRSTLRPFAFDHYQDNRSGVDFAGQPLENFNVIANNPGDVDTDGDGTLDSVWLDLGSAVTLMPDRKYVKPLFAIRCIDLGGRVSLNAHGSPLHTSSFSPQAIAEFAPKRDSSGNKTSPTRMTVGLGFGAADVRLDAVIEPSNLSAVMFGSNSATGSGEGIRRDIGAIVGRYGDGVGSLTSMPRPGQPNVREWSAQVVPDEYALKNGPASRFLGSPPDFWSRLAVGIDHRGQPFYANVAPSISLQDTTDNPYELDLYAARPGNGYAQPPSYAANVDQPFTAAELEAIARPFDIDNAAALPPRALALSLAGDPSSLATNGTLVATDTWDTPAVIPGDSVPFGSSPDPDLSDGLKMDLNRPLGDGTDNDGDGIADEPGETGDPYAGTFVDRNGDTQSWLLTRGLTPPNNQPGTNEPHLRARQLLAYHLFNLVDGLRETFAKAGAKDPGFRLFGLKSDQDDDNCNTDPALQPVALDPALNQNGPPVAGDFTGKQLNHNRRVIAQWAVNVVDFLDADAIMTPFRYDVGNSDVNVVWGCEHPDVMLTETLAMHDRRTADTACDPSGEKTTDFRAEYTVVFNKWKAWNDSGRNGPEPKYPSVTDSDGDPTDADDMDFDQVRIPEGSLFLELYGLRNPNAPTLPRELYSYDAASKQWTLDLGRVPAGSIAPVWRLSISTNRAQATPPTDVFNRIAANPDTEWLSPTSQPAKIGTDVGVGIDIDRYVWFSSTGAALPANGTTAAAHGNGPNRNNTFYLRDQSLSPTLRPGGYLIVGPRQQTFVGSLNGGSGGQTWGYPSKQKIVLNGGTPDANHPAVAVYGLDGTANPSVPVPDGARFGNALPPPSARAETASVWLAMDPPSTWTAWNSSWNGVGKSGIGLNVSEPLRGSYYPCPTVKNPATQVYDAYGPLNDQTHNDFLPSPVDQTSGPLLQKMLSGGSFANFCTVFVERLADPTRPFESDSTKPGWNPYIVVDFMPVDLTVFNGESKDYDPEETQGEDRPDLPSPRQPLPVLASVPPRPSSPIDPSLVPLPFADASQLAARHVYFHSRQRGFGKDLPQFDNNKTLFGLGDPATPIRRNYHPFKPLGSTDDVADTPLRKTTVSATVDFTDPTKYRLPGGRPTVARDAAVSQACFLHELGQSPDGRATPSDWQRIPYHSLGWVNSCFGRRLDVADSVPASYAGSPDMPFPWLVWNDRPFANPYELIFVPRTAPSRLLTNYRNLDYPAGLEPDRTTPKYANVTAGSSYNVADIFAACAAGAHLLPVTSITDIPAAPATRSRHADVLVRLFEYLRVRSPFNGSETLLTGNGGDGRPDRFVGPFSRISKYREPGKINVNTIDPDLTAGATVWNAICGGTGTGVLPEYSSIAGSGTGAGLVPVPFVAMTSGTIAIRKPYRAASGSRADFTESNQPRGYSNTMFATGWLTNPPVLGHPELWYVPSGSNPQEISDRFSVRSFTLLGDQPRTSVGSGRRNPLFPAPQQIDSWANDGQRNAWFRFEALVRANANTTVRSEVYAIWVTMGLFEVQGNQTPATLYPDGYRLVREYGSDTGNVTRHRAFYIFDRSVPIGFERGSDHNVQDGLLVERFIE